MEQKKVRKTFRIEPDLWERFVRINDRLAVNGSEILRRMIEKYVEDKEKELGRVAEVESANQTKRNKEE